MEKLARTPIESPVPDFTEAWRTGGEAGWRAASKQWLEDHRQRTKLIPRRMFGKNPDLTLDNFYDLLQVYYWWDDSWNCVEAGAEDVLADLTRPQFKTVTRAIHARFPDYCNARYDSTERTTCTEPDGWQCYKQQYGFRSGASVKKMAELFGVFFFGLDDEDEGPLGPDLRAYTVRRLGEAGLDAIEADYAATVLDLEAERRIAQQQRNMKEFAEHMRTGGTFQSFIAQRLPAILLEPDQLESIVDEYEDVPDTWQEWDESKKLALVRRFINSNVEWTELWHISYEWETYGILPPYLYAMRPDGIFPGEI